MASAARVDSINTSWYCNLPSNLLCVAVQNLLIGNSKFNLPFNGNIFTYARDKIQQRIFPAINIYPSESSYNSPVGRYKGTIIIEFNLPLSVANENRTLQAMTAAEAFFMVVTKPNFFYPLRAQVPGLLQFAYASKIDYSKLAKRTNQDSFTTTFSANYLIDLVQFYEYLMAYGISPEDPCTVVYPQITGIAIKVFPIAKTQG